MEEILKGKLEEIKNRYLELDSKLASGATFSDMAEHIKVSKEHKKIIPIFEAYNHYEKIISELNGLEIMIEEEEDANFKKELREDIVIHNEKKNKLEEELKMLLIPKDPNDEKNVFLEIRAGEGGDESGIFAGDLFRMYQRFSDNNGWKIELVSCIDSPSGGYKEIIASISGEDVYGVLKFESGVHRVQRVPETENKGRVHTSAVSVVVLPEAEEVDIDLNMNDVRKDTFCSSGPGGQSVNTTYSAIRLTHIPTGLVVSCQDEKSQIKNLEKAKKVLISRLYDIEMKKQQDSLSSDRKSMIKNSDRSEKIRTYNYPQGRITDHRINYSLYNLQSFMDGDIKDMTEKLRISEEENFRK